MTDKEKYLRYLNGVDKLVRSAWISLDLGEPDAEWQPMVHFIGGKGDEIVLVAGGFQNDEQKDGFVHFCQEKSLALQSYAVVFISESWQVVVPEGTPFPEERPSRDPRRKESLDVTICAREGVTVTSFPIRRDDNGYRTLGKPERYDAANARGRMTQLLNPLFRADFRH